MWSHSSCALALATQAGHDAQPGATLHITEGVGPLEGDWIPVEVKCICPFSEPYGQSKGQIKRDGRYALNQSSPHLVSVHG